MRILIELPTWLGDTIMTTPAIENLINYYKESEFILVGSEISIEIFKNHHRIYKTYIFDKKYSSLFLITRKLGKFDVFFSFRDSFRSNFFKFLVRSNIKFTYKKNNFHKLHQVEKYSVFINKSLNIKLPIGPLIIQLGDSLIKASDLNKIKRPILGINPGASYGNAKRWYPEEFASVAADLSNEYDIAILGGPNEKEIAMDIEKLLVNKGVKNYENLAGTLNISQLIERIFNLNLFITGDSGPMHIAASFQVPTVSIFGPTKDKETSQWNNEKSVILKTNLECQPCMRRTCPLKHHNCMKLIKAIDVLNAVKSFDNKLSVSLE